MRRIRHVASADFRQRVHSKRLLVVLAVVAYFGYLVNVGGVELVYQVPIDGGDSYRAYYGEPTAAFIGIKAALTGSFVLLFGGYSLLTGTLTRDQQTGVAQIIATTPVTDREILLGKWLSHLGIVSLLLVTLSVATVINHLVAGVGTTNPVAIIVPIFVFGLPLGGVVAGVSLLFEATDRLAGTLGSIVYFTLSIASLAALVAALDSYPGELPIAARAVDVLGYLLAYQVTAEPFLQVVPDYAGGLPSFGQVYSSEAPETYRYVEPSLPAWGYVHRSVLLVCGIVVATIASVPYRRWAIVNDGPGRVRTFLSSLWRTAAETTGSTVESSTPIDANTSLTAVSERQSGGFIRLLRQEFRLAFRGQPWWWYLGALGVVASGWFVSGPARLGVVSVALIWPLFVWSSLGVRSLRYGTTPFILSSGTPYGQLLAEWTSGAVVTTLVVGMAIISGGVNMTALLTVAITVVFVPSFALASGLWSESSRPFELGLLLLWYVGPVNGVTQLDFVGASGDSPTATLIGFGAAGVVCFLAAAVHRHRSLNGR